MHRRHLSGPALYQEIADMACERIKAAITATLAGDRPVKAILDAYNPTGSTALRQLHHLEGPTRWQTDPRKCHVNWVVCDSDWEAEFCRVAEATRASRLRQEPEPRPRGALPDGLHAEETLPPRLHRPGSTTASPDPLNLIVEIKGFRGEDAKEKANTMRAYWVPGVNNLGKFGRWAFAEFTAVYEIEAEFKRIDTGRNPFI
jgi:type III restriction enzyme